mmetsp:Transcript_59691/g.163646  ORF Transcript_59691/g.163646 Transcript_59691/m.163646 type:complete len:257 (-) Transcript_59691:203-973(-)
MSAPPVTQASRGAPVYARPSTFWARPHYTSMSGARRAHRSCTGPRRAACAPSASMLSMSQRSARRPRWVIASCHSLVRRAPRCTPPAPFHGLRACQLADRAGQILIVRAGGLTSCACGVEACRRGGAVARALPRLVAVARLQARLPLPRLPHDVSAERRLRDPRRLRRRVAAAARGLPRPLAGGGEPGAQRGLGAPPGGHREWARGGRARERLRALRGGRAWRSWACGRRIAAHVERVLQAVFLAKGALLTLMGVN